MTENIPKCLQVLKNRQMQKKEARLRQQNNIQAPHNFSQQQKNSKNFDNENFNQYQQQTGNYDTIEKKERKPLETLSNVNLQYRNKQQNQSTEKIYNQPKQIVQEQSIQQRRAYQNQAQYSPPNEDFDDNYYNNFSNDASNSNLDDSPIQNSSYNPSSPQTKNNQLQAYNPPPSSPPEYYNKPRNSSSNQSRQQSQNYSNKQNLNEQQYFDAQEYKLLIERNKTLEKQIEILQLNQKSFSEMNNQSSQLEDALNRISDLEQMLSAKEKKFQIATDAIAQFQSEINELTAKYKQQGKELLQAQKKIKDLELTNEKLVNQIQDSQFYNKFYDDDAYGQALDSNPLPNQNKYLSNQKEYIDEDRLEAKRQFSRFPDENINGTTKMSLLNQRGRYDDDPYEDRQINRFNDYDQQNSKFNSTYNELNRNYDFNQSYQPESQMNRYGQPRSSIDNDYDNRNSFNKPSRINQESALLSQNPSTKPLSQNKETSFNKPSAVHPAMKDNLFFGDDQPEKKDNYDIIVQELRDDEIQHDFESFTREKEEKERILSKAPEKGISLSKSRRMKEQLENEIDALSRKIGILKREMKQRGLYC
ncbi:hypothetical protein M9Y10_044543 [Tritrichomonas musculus]|uniref:Enkurin domain-containing protein n=1 Tax=Tritrichomonas musculus TaxID=1915356 RepID=A0ABR2JSZ7_9EUKA